jgi:CRP-like cAMP-binding protein
MTEIVRLSAGEMLIHEGDESLEMYYVQSGTLAVFKRKGDSEHQIGTIIAGELVGEMSFLDKQPRSATVKAMTDCELIEVPHEKFDKLLNSHPKWFKALIHTLCDRLRKANARLRI